ncbi:adenylosuccinate lyase [Sinomicrobium pectinilyticum]|uniref:Adenylosuccinate lyase n=1 Tax=Sinomicrobium pectinilyticum TaxID=1084421 RepID=A0A3N0DR21_SINP1|nr:adenylosuccinate lyase [Sinomicrobium pectinilyticum]RNL78094.1 adenylosuccinate lyase [Sinomicrobium pectinilyticum]
MKNCIYDKLDYVNALRERRKQLSEEILSTPSLFPDLVSACFSEDEIISTKACWVLEFVCKEKLYWIIPSIDTFTANIRTLKADGAIRSAGKVCELLCERYFDKHPNQIKKSLTEEHLHKITETCFDWLIGNRKVAVKAYAMYCLFLLGTKFEWIYPELRLILMQGYGEHSAAYRSRAKHILDKLAGET